MRKIISFLVLPLLAATTHAQQYPQQVPEGASFLFFRNYTHYHIKVRVPGHGDCIAPPATGWTTNQFRPGVCFVHGLPHAGHIQVENNLGERTEADVQRLVEVSEDVPPNVICSEDRQGLTCLR